MVRDAQAVLDRELELILHQELEDVSPREALQYLDRFPPKSVDTPSVSVRPSRILTS